MRSAAATLAVLAEQQFLDFLTPSFSALRGWLLRLGCYALSRPLDRSSAWVWLIDHTVQIGTLKLFVIVGCPLDQVPFGERCLRLSDLQLVALVPMENSTKERVNEALEEATARTGVPRLIVSDDGSDVRGGAELFRGRHPETARVSDVAHVGANTLEHYWDQDERWHSFVRQLGQTNQKIRQTKAAAVLSPTLRPKARFMKVGPLIRFATRILRWLDSANPPAVVEEKYGWLREYRADLAGWQEEHRVVQTTIEVVRRDGLSGVTMSKVEEAWGPLSERPRTRKVAGRMRAYVAKNARGARAGETLVGSTEVLESAFGKLKRLEGTQAESGLTGLTLALGAILSEWEEDEIREGLDAVPKKEAEGWVKRHLGTSVQWLRRRLLAADDTEPKPR